ncbi:MAG: carboxypeptidase-like regulatory domain-containing protein, partial [Acidobacteriota bacterium]
RLPLLALFLILLAPTASLAHALSLWAEVLDDTTVRVEVHTTDGRPVAGAAIRVTAADGTLRASGETDTEGRFEMRREQAESLTIHASSGGHHQAEAVLDADGSLRDD